MERNKSARSPFDKMRDHDRALIGLFCGNKKWLFSGGK
jgi:hypothetical protein